MLEIFLALRDPDVALWMERITSDWTVVKRKFEQIPKKVWKSNEVILEILRNSKTALSYADAELLDDAGFLLQACQMRGYKKNVTPPDSLQWLETVADCQVCLCYAMKQDDQDMAKRVITRFERMITKANQMDIVTFVVFPFLQRFDVMEGASSDIAEGFVAASLVTWFLYQGSRGFGLSSSSAARAREPTSCSCCVRPFAASSARQPPQC